MQSIDLTQDIVGLAWHYGISVIGGLVAGIALGWLARRLVSAWYGGPRR